MDTNNQIYKLQNLRWKLYNEVIYKNNEFRYFKALNNQISVIIGKNNKVYLSRDKKEGYQEIKKISKLLTPKEDKFITKLNGNHIYIITSKLLITFNLKTSKTRLLKRFKKLRLNNFTFDTQNNLWISTDNGVIFIELNTNFYTRNNKYSIRKKYKVNKYVVEIIRGHRELMIIEDTIVKKRV